MTQSSAQYLWGRRGNTPGFTLIELATAILVIGILSAIAYPNYTSSIQKSRRGDAIAVLTAITQAQERYRMSHAAYAGDTETLNVDVSKISKHYEIAISGDAVTGMTNVFRLTATPLSTSPQSNDLRCGQLIVSLIRGQLEYISKDSTGASITTPECWPK
ncbi:type IV pilin protein [Roseateles paludis]|jgi:type IV pilus assembly protein PilE|uniref:Type IV pilin protein n=1 Tax=Roseateles paludis TaxID=3145238 RepID=A0ABV0G7Q5_9BURK